MPTHERPDRFRLETSRTQQYTPRPFLGSREFYGMLGMALVAGVLMTAMWIVSRH